MAKIQITSYDGAETKIERLGLKPLLDELEQLISFFEIRVAEERQATAQP